MKTSDKFEELQIELFEEYEEPPSQDEEKKEERVIVIDIAGEDEATYI